MTKRLFDIFLASIAIILFMPIFLTAVIAIYFSDYGPILFKQKRVGLGGLEFDILKFRSMVINAEKLGGFSSENNDPRITKIGKFIRRTSIDELPQLFNVLMGNMSVVGPRPDVLAQENNYTEEEWKLRYSVRPGITGLAQAIYRSDATFQQRKDLDFHYIRNSSISFDLYILLITVRQVFQKGGN